MLRLLSTMMLLATAAPFAGPVGTCVQTKTTQISPVMQFGGFPNPFAQPEEPPAPPPKKGGRAKKAPEPEIVEAGSGGGLFGSMFGGGGGGRKSDGGMTTAMFGQPAPEPTKKKGKSRGIEPDKWIDGRSGPKINPAWSAWNRANN